MQDHILSTGGDAHSYKEQEKGEVGPEEGFELRVVVYNSSTRFELLSSYFAIVGHF